MEFAKMTKLFLLAQRKKQYIYKIDWDPFRDFLHIVKWKQCTYDLWLKPG